MNLHWNDIPQGTRVFFWDSSGMTSWAGTIDAADTEYYIREAWVTCVEAPNELVEVKLVDGKKTSLCRYQLYLSYAGAAKSLERYLTSKLEHVHRSLDRLYENWKEYEV